MVEAQSIQKISDDLIEILNSATCTTKSKIIAVSNVLRSIGVTLYDKTDVSKEAVEADYQLQPTFPAGLILISHMPYDLLRLLNVSASESETST